MCGIAGLLHFDPSRPVDRAVLDAMTDVLAHRGPDGRGTHVDGALGLGHRRLAVIDLSADAAQPMPNEDGSVWTVLNGELYGFQALRAELEARGHRFRSRSDTEVLVHLYEEEGERLVERLRGMFAFALWDARRRRLVLARDRFGKKPLYYRLDADGLRFGSEVKALLADPAAPRAPDPLALSEYLTYGYVPAPRTAFAGVKKLPPGHVLVVEQDGRHALRRYWSLPLGPKRDGDERRAIEEVREALDEAVRLRMVADVPLGAFLSGGLDSSSVVASMVAASRRPADVRTFSIGFQEATHDESPYAALVAGHLGTSHEALSLAPGAFDDLERIAWHHGEPFADSSCLPTFAVSRLARQRVTVALSGDGGDELFLGYDRYRGARVDELLRRTPRALRAPLENRYLIHLLHLLDPTRRVGQQLTLAREYLGHGLEDMYLRRVEVFWPEVKRTLVSPDLAAATRGHDARDVVRDLLRASPGETWAERCAHADVGSYLVDDILVKVDVASMAFGLEVRAPLLDHVLAERVARLPARLKMRRLATKLALRRAVADRLPREVLRRPKMGFGVPLHAWFRGGLAARLEDALLSRRAVERGLLRPEVVRRLIDQHAAGQVDHQARLFALLMLETWFRQWIDAPAPAVRPARPLPIAGAPR
ncbi:MAG: asparagine synthase (glutamine-hydrolyzing) [Planctomycetes bacterium]|nr:asparagine synthase (glutamine-hydrolyzing) [Planctomycetota bacterium]